MPNPFRFEAWGICYLVCRQQRRLTSAVMVVPRLMMDLGQAAMGNASHQFNR